VECPNCGRANSPYVLQCECGYGFSTASQHEELVLAQERYKPIVQTNLASLGARLVAQLIDSLIALFVAVLFLSVSTSGVAWVGVLLAWAYILFCDCFPGGRSIGKRALYIAVVDEHTGGFCKPWQSFVRNITLSILAIIDIAFIFTDSRQRLGDRLAHTIVVKV